MGSVNVDKTFLQDVARNRQEMIYFLGHVNQFYLPPTQYMTNRYIGLLLSGKKKLLRLSELVSDWVPPQSQFMKMPDIM